MAALTPGLSSLVDDICESIAILLESLHEKPALILLYSGIDILGALDTDDGLARQESFVRWADVFMKPLDQLGCSGLELYSARCGLLHALSPLARLTKAGKAREFAYVTYPPFSPDQNVAGDLFVVHLPMLWVAFRDGAKRFIDDVGRDVARTGRIERNLDNVYVTRTR